VRGQAEKKVLTKDLLCPMTGEGSGIISSEPKVIAMGFAPSLISLRKNTEVEERSGGERGSVVGRNASRR
jgi:proteasome assembly chaperone (PAC2) family protein